MKALVTGGAGLIGSTLVDKLLAKGYDVVILDNLEPEGHRGIKPPWIPKVKNCKFIKGDVRDKRDLYKALKDVDVVFHQAAYGGFSTELSKFVDVNAMGTSRIFDVIHEKKLKVKKIVVASSQAVYGEGKYKCSRHGIQFPSTRDVKQFLKGQWEVKCPKCSKNMTHLPTDELKPIDPSHVYSISKYAEEKIALLLGKQLGIPTVALRYSVTYGPRQSLFNPYTGVCSIFSTLLLNNLPPILYEDGNQVRDFVFVGDVADANIFVSKSAKANFEAFNVGYGKPIKVVDFAKTIAREYKKDIDPILKKEFRPGDLRHLYSDNSKLAKIGFKPKTKLKDGIKQYADWIREQGSVKEYFSEAYKKMKKSGVVQKARGK